MEFHAIALPRALAQPHLFSINRTPCKWPNCVVSQNFFPLHRSPRWKHPSCSRRSMIVSALPVDDWEQFSPLPSDDLKEEPLAPPVSSDVLKALLADKEREKLVRKLSEANQHNRFLKRQLQLKEDDLVKFKSELAVTELEIQALVALAEEIANAAIAGGSRMINGNSIQSHLLSRLEAVQERLKEQIEDIEAAELKEVPLFWIGVAENVQVMGSFDGWSEGEHLSPEYTGSYTKFSTTLSLRPGRYEIKFLVDGEWQISPEFPTVGDGWALNNLLIVA